MSAYETARMLAIRFGSRVFKNPEAFLPLVEARKERFKILGANTLRSALLGVLAKSNATEEEYHDLTVRALSTTSGFELAKWLMDVVWIQTGRPRFTPYERIFYVWDLPIVRQIFDGLLDGLRDTGSQTETRVITEREMQLGLQLLGSRTLATWGGHLLNPDFLLAISQRMAGLSQQARLEFLTEVANSLIKSPATSLIELTAMLNLIQRGGNKANQAN